MSHNSNVITVIKDTVFNKADWNTHINMHTTLTQERWRRPTMLARHSVGTYRGNELTHNLSGNACPVISAQWATVDWFCLKRNGCALASPYIYIYIYIYIHTVQAGEALLNLPYSPCVQGKSHHHHHHHHHQTFKVLQWNHHYCDTGHSLQQNRPSGSCNAPYCMDPTCPVTEMF